MMAEKVFYLGLSHYDFLILCQQFKHSTAGLPLFYHGNIYYLPLFEKSQFSQPLLLNIAGKCLIFSHPRQTPNSVPIPGKLPICSYPRQMPNLFPSQANDQSVPIPDKNAQSFHIPGKYPIFSHPRQTLNMKAQVIFPKLPNTLGMVPED